MHRGVCSQLSQPRSPFCLQTVDQFAVWALKTIRSLSRAGEQETVSEVIIPLVQPWLPTQQPLMKEADFNSAVSGGAQGQPISLSFDLPNNGLLDPQTRLKSIGVSFGNKSNIVPGSGIDRNFAEGVRVPRNSWWKSSRAKKGSKQPSDERRLPSRFPMSCVRQVQQIGHGESAAVHSGQLEQHPFVRSAGPSLRPDLPYGRAPRAAAVKDAAANAAAPAEPARSVLDRASTVLG
jgi:hypothetical protein